MRVIDKLFLYNKHVVKLTGRTTINDASTMLFEIELHHHNDIVRWTDWVHRDELKEIMDNEHK